MHLYIDGQPESLHRSFSKGQIFEIDFAREELHRELVIVNVFQKLTQIVVY